MSSNTNYNAWVKTDLIKRIKALEEDKKYGLVWDSEREPEKVVVECQTKLPVLNEDIEKQIVHDTNQVTHFLIEGDNFHALSVLNYTHEKGVDVVYIDPPFNTGSRSWKYNNNYIEREDAFKHSKWITFMNNRLRLARNVLSDKGIIIVAIDDYECHTLRLLMDEIFGEDNRLGTIVVVHNPRGRNDDKYFATMHEYMLIYAKYPENVNIAKFDFREEELDQFDKNDSISAFALTSFMRTGNNSDRSTRPKLFYSIFVNPDNLDLSLSSHPGWVELLPVNPKGEEKTWRWGRETFNDKWQTELTVKNSLGSYKIYKKRRIDDVKGKKPRTVWYNPRYDASSNGIMLLNNILGNKHGFPYPKSLYTVEDILSLCTNKNSIVLDFFAGSGTTGHAILELNKQDSGRRQVILCTNNENGIMEEVCYPRMMKVMGGYKKPNGEIVDGLGSNLKFYKTNFVPTSPMAPTDSDKQQLTNHSLEMLTLKEGTFEKVISTTEYVIFENTEKYTGIIFDQRSIGLFKKTIKNFNKPICLYIFSLTADDFGDEFADMVDIVKICSIPDAILRVYRRIFR